MTYSQKIAVLAQTQDHTAVNITDADVYKESSRYYLKRLISFLRKKVAALFEIEDNHPHYRAFMKQNRYWISHLE